MRKPVTHSLKTAAPYWDAIAAGWKNFEVRRDDRGFQRGDTLMLRRMSDDHPSYYKTPTGESEYPRDALTIEATVAWVLTGGQLGVEPGYVVMALTDISRV